MEKTIIDPNTVNILTLAYIGDSIYEVYVREHIVTKSPNKKVQQLHKEAVTYVCAKSQAQIVKELYQENIITDEQWQVVLRGRNHKKNPPKNGNRQDYDYATGYEALIGYLYLKKENEKIQEIMKYSIEYIEKNKEGNK